MKRYMDGRCSLLYVRGYIISASLLKAAIKVTGFPALLWPLLLITADYFAKLFTGGCGYVGCVGIAKLLHPTVIEEACAHLCVGGV